MPKSTRSHRQHALMVGWLGTWCSPNRGNQQPISHCDSQENHLLTSLSVENIAAFFLLKDCYYIFFVIVIVSSRCLRWADTSVEIAQMDFKSITTLTP